MFFNPRVKNRIRRSIESFTMNIHHPNALALIGVMLLSYGEGFDGP